MMKKIESFLLILTEQKAKFRDLECKMISINFINNSLHILCNKMVKKPVVLTERPLLCTSMEEVMRTVVDLLDLIFCYIKTTSL